ncbi:MAG: hypothetical protein M3Y87_15135 [Myxococcota bacterium]|nr:hypothetical protein [Myxococcota bacterium]
MRRGEVDAGKSDTGALTTMEREELQRLRRDNKRLQMEREILKKAGLLTKPWVMHSTPEADIGRRA